MTRNRRIEDLIEEWSPEIKAAFLLSIRNIKDAAQIGLIAERLERGDIDGAVRAVGLEPALFRPFDKAIVQAFEAGGDFVSGGFPRVRDPNGQRLSVLFDVRNIRAENWLKDHSSRKITQIIDDQRAMIRTHMREGMQAGQNPRTVALELVGRVSSVTRKREGGAIGLTSSQEEWARAYRQELSDPKTASRALGRTLRDKRFDASVRKATKSGEPLSADQIEKMVTAYRNRALRYRAESIARTEAMTALHQGQHEATQQAIDKGTISAANVIRVWHTAGDKRVRDTHAAMNGQQVRGMSSQFTSPSGATLRFPGDPNARASEIINCRCWLEQKYDWFNGLT